jgi:hypothetical protein
MKVLTSNSHRAGPAGSVRMIEQLVPIGHPVRQFAAWLSHCVIRSLFGHCAIGHWSFPRRGPYLLRNKNAQHVVSTTYTKSETRRNALQTTKFLPASARRRRVRELQKIKTKSCRSLHFPAQVPDFTKCTSNLRSQHSHPTRLPVLPLYLEFPENRGSDVDYSSHPFAVFTAQQRLAPRTPTA